MKAVKHADIPLKLNSVGVIPPIFAGSILLFPTILAGFSTRMGAESGILVDGSVSWP